MKRSAVSLLVAFVAFVGLATAIPAYAGSNGQQLELVDNLGYVYSACANGTNQSGGSQYKCWSTPNYYNPLSGYWWVGSTSIDEYNSSGGYIQTVYTTVPRSSSTNYWCFYDSNGSGWAC
jgi:hypothetical protein